MIAATKRKTTFIYKNSRLDVVHFYPAELELAVMSVSSVVHTSCCFHSSANTEFLVRTASSSEVIDDFIGSMSMRDKYNSKWKSETAWTQQFTFS